MFKPLYGCIATLALIAFTAVQPARSQTPEITLEQVDFTLPYQQSNSTSGIANVIYSPLDSLEFINILARTSPGGTEVWIIRNLPLRLLDNPDTISSWFDLEPLGVSDGVDISQLEIAYDIDDDIWTGQQTLGNWATYSVEDFTYDVGDGVEGEPTSPLPINVREPDSESSILKMAVGDDEKILRPKTPNIELNSAAADGKPQPNKVVAGKPVPGYAGDHNACAPAAAANGMKWLGDQHKEAKVDQSDRARLKELSGLMVRWVNSPTMIGWMAEGKLRYILRHKLPVAVKFQSAFFKKGTNIPNLDDKKRFARNDNASDQAYPTWEWLCEEMKTEAVEISIIFYDKTTKAAKGGHALVVSGIANTKDGKTIWVKDDQQQDKAGGTKETALKWVEVKKKVGNVEITIPKFTGYGDQKLDVVLVEALSQSLDKTVTYGGKKPALGAGGTGPTIKHLARLRQDPDSRAMGGNGSGGIDLNGCIFVWGDNSDGQLGIGSTDPVCKVKKMLKGEYVGTDFIGDGPLNHITNVATGPGHRILLDQLGQVYGVGSNSDGELGQGAPGGDELEPVMVNKGEYEGAAFLGDNPLNMIFDIAAGGTTSPETGFSLARDAAGLVYAWGNNAEGQLGNGSTSPVYEPTLVLAGEYSGTAFLGDTASNPMLRLAAGASHSAALAMDGTVFTWGRNDEGQLGNGSISSSLVPVRVLKGAGPGVAYLGDDPANPMQSISAAGDHMMALATDGSVYAWGGNSSGDLGDGTTSDRNMPVRVLKGEYPGGIYLGDDPANPVIQVSAGVNVNLALMLDGSVYAWGANNEGQLGIGTTDVLPHPLPVRVFKGTYNGTLYLGDDPTNPIIDIAAGADHGAALASDLRVYAWGRNAEGQLGDCSNDRQLQPVTVQHNGSDLRLPVELSDYSVTSDSDRVYIDWRTASEVNNAGFEVERARTSDSLFVPISSYLTNPDLVGLGTSPVGKSYGYVDGTDGSLRRGGEYLYRLVDVSLDGVRTTHAALRVSISSDPSTRHEEFFSVDAIIPNPTTDAVTVSFQLPEREFVSVEINAADGRRMLTPVGREFAAGTHSMTIETGELPAGSYQLSIRAGGSVRVRRFVLLR